MTQTEQHQSLAEQLLRAMADNGGSARIPALRELAGSEDRFQQTWSELAQRNLITPGSGGGWQLSIAGWAQLMGSRPIMIEHAGRLWAEMHGRPKSWQELLAEADAQETESASSFAGLRERYVNSLPAREELVRDRAAAAAAARRKAVEAEKRAMLDYLQISDLWPGWRLELERDPKAPNILALYPPPFSDAPEGEAYIRLQVDVNGHRLWLQASTGGPMESLEPHLPPVRIRTIVLWLFIPAADATAPALPVVENQGVAG